MKKLTKKKRKNSQKKKTRNGFIITFIKATKGLPPLLRQRLKNKLIITGKKIKKPTFDLIKS